MAIKRQRLNPYYTGSTLWELEEAGLSVCTCGLNPYYTGSTLWVVQGIVNGNAFYCLNPYYTGSTLWVDNTINIGINNKKS